MSDENESFFHFPLLQRESRTERLQNQRASTSIWGCQRYKKMFIKQVREAGREWPDHDKFSQGAGRHQLQAAVSLSLLPAEPVPVFCRGDPLLLLGLVIRWGRRSGKDKQLLHQLHQEPWLHTESPTQSSLTLHICVSPPVHWPTRRLPKPRLH